QRKQSNRTTAEGQQSNRQSANTHWRNREVAKSKQQAHSILTRANPGFYRDYRHGEAAAHANVDEGQSQQNQFAAVFPRRACRIRRHAFRPEFSQEFARTSQPKNPARKNHEGERKHQPDNQTAVNQMTIPDELSCPDHQQAIRGEKPENAHAELAVKTLDVLTLVF